MSFILDALRKSDSERQQQAAPGLASTVQRKEPRRRSFWVPLLVVVLGLNAAVGWFLLRDDEPGVNATSPTETATRSLRKEPVPVPAQPLPRKMPDEPAGKPPRVEVSPPAQVARPPAAALPAPAARVEAPPAPAASASTRTESTLPSFEQLLVAGMISSPPLHLDIHVFAPESAKRFVFINMKKYREGDQLDEGPAIETITNTGVILTQNGNRFTLERN